MSNNNEYELIKDFGALTAGTIFNPVSALCYAAISNPHYHIELCKEFVENNPEWFRKVVVKPEPRKPKWTDEEIREWESYADLSNTNYDTIIEIKKNKGVVTSVTVKSYR